LKLLAKYLQKHDDSKKIVSTIIPVFFGVFATDLNDLMLKLIDKIISSIERFWF